MKKIISILLLSVFLLPVGCAAQKKPKAFVLPQCAASVVFGENSFEVMLECGEEESVITMKANRNAFDTRYTFHKKSVTLEYDAISAELDISSLPDTNTAALIYKMVAAIAQGDVQWSRQEAQYDCSGKVNGTSFSGACDSGGNLCTLEVPEYGFYLKTIEK